MKARKTVPLEERFWGKVKKGASDECWLWLGTIDMWGYGRIKVGDKMRSAHRAAYEFAVAAVPGGLELDHLCRNRACVNPAHLEPVTHAENMRRSAPAQKTHCIHGHEYTSETTQRAPDGRRACRVCRRDGDRRYRQRKAA